jgi:hypothetical protein
MIKMEENTDFKYVPCRSNMVRMAARKPKFTN